MTTEKRNQIINMINEYEKENNVTIFTDSPDLPDIVGELTDVGNYLTIWEDEAARELGENWIDFIDMIKTTGVHYSIEDNPATLLNSILTGFLFIKVLADYNRIRGLE